MDWWRGPDKDVIVSFLFFDFPHERVASFCLGLKAIKARSIYRTICIYSSDNSKSVDCNLSCPRHSGRIELGCCSIVCRSMVATVMFMLMYTPE